MTTINSMEDLIRVLDEHPEWLEAVRVRLLTRELLELPQTVAGLAATVSELSNEVKTTSAAVKELTNTVNELANELRATNRRLDRLQDDVGWLKGRIIYDIVRDEAALIAGDIGFSLERTLVRTDLRRLTEGQDLSDLPLGEVRSLHRADLVMEVADSEGNLHYIAVEASFTANGRDSRRALRNAELLTRLTGRPSVAAVAGVRYDRGLQYEIESDQLYWYEISTEALEAE